MTSVKGLRRDYSAEYATSRTSERERAEEPYRPQFGVYHFLVSAVSGGYYNVITWPVKGF